MWATMVRLERLGQFATFFNQIWPNAPSKLILTQEWQGSANLPNKAHFWPSLA